MLVSAISATHNQVIRPVNYGFVNSRGGENNADAPVLNHKNDDKEVYKSINEWKAFCHDRIAGGKLNIIA